jgi:hypothetical protein
MKSASEPNDNELHARLNAFLQADAGSETADEGTIRGEVQRFVAGTFAEIPGEPVRDSWQRSTNQQLAARRTPDARGAKPYKPAFYGPVARLADRWVGRADGKAGIPALSPESMEIAGAPTVTTPYMEIIRRSFLDRCEYERLRMLGDLQPVYRELAALRQRIAGAGENLAIIRKHLDQIPEVPDEAVLAYRHPAERHAVETLVRTRRQREHHARRAAAQAQERQATAIVHELRAQEARLTETIGNSEEILAARIRQLHEHSLRRCATYLHHLVHRHPHGAALTGFLNLNVPALPGWLQYPGAYARATGYQSGHSSSLAADGATEEEA